MANTIIQIKRSSITTAPGSLQAAEPAYSYLSDKLFIGDATGAVIEIGGRYYINVAQQSWNTANAAFSAANAAFAKANTVAGDADEKANAALITANIAFDAANAAYDTANIAIANVNYVNTATKSAYDFANTVYSNYAYPAYVAVGPAFNAANAGFTQANTANTTAKYAYDAANAAYQNSNTKLAIAGGTITGNLSVLGSLTVSGNAYTIDSQTLRVSDPLIYLAGNNYVSDIVDIGFVANYVNASSINVHTGLIRDAGTKQYYLFKEYSGEPDWNDINIAANNFTLDTLNANFITSNLTLGGANAIAWIRAAYDQANTGGASGAYAFDAANAAFAQGNTTVTSLGANWTATNSVFGQANTVLFPAINSAFTQANTAYTVGNSAFAQANAASAQAANADFLTSGTVASARISGSYTGITGLGTITVGTWQANTINVNYGGTGLASIANNNILYSTGSSTKLSTLSGTDGNVLQVNSFGTPFFGMLDGGAF